MRNGTIALLEADPELGRLLSGSRLQEAVREVTVQTHRLETGPWDAERLKGAGAEHVGMLLLDGLIAREIALADNVSCELLGPGDIVRPWQVYDPAQLLRAEVRWTVLRGGQLGLLDRRFAALLTKYPEVNAMVVDRLSERTQRLAVSQAISQLNGVDRRLLALFWHLAERWGRVVPGGVTVALPIPHRLIAQLVGARRPTVSTAIGQLAERGDLVRTPDGAWLLRGEPVGLPVGEAARVIRGRRRRFQSADVTPVAATVPASGDGDAPPLLPTTGRVRELHDVLEVLRRENQRRRADLQSLMETSQSLMDRIAQDRERRRSSV